jgi:Glycosyltransferase Family 4
MLRILITNNALAHRGGSEVYVRDLATALLERGHAPIAYSTLHGDVAEELRPDLPVVDDLDALGTPPDIIHGHHHVETMTALLRFPDVPAVYVYHGWRPWEETPPRFPRIQRYVAVSTAGRERLVFEHGIPEDRVRIVLNFVDLTRFQPRDRPLPARPVRALFFSNRISPQMLDVVREACARTGMSLDTMGARTGNGSALPEAVLGSYDVVFATGRSALEALAVGAVVVLCDALTASTGPMVTTRDLARLRSLNFVGRAVREPLRVEGLEREILRYDPADAEEVSRCIRATAGRDGAVDQLIALYHETIAEWRTTGPGDRAAEWHAAARYLRRIGTRVKERDALRGEVARLNHTLATLEATATMRLRNRLMRAPIGRGLAHWGVRMAARLVAPRP